VTTPSPLRQRAPDGARVDPDVVRIGKDIIEILTTGMYVSPVTIYREYIQNAADSIDAARAGGVFGHGQRGNVSIAFDHPARSVTIRDNGAGIAARDALPILVAIGGSPKRGSNARGFRGVGRLSGLAYCRELQFRTKAAGEQKITAVTWDCRALRERLTDGVFGGDLRRVIADVVTVSQEKTEDGDDHFFEVRLNDIARLRNDLLLNEKQTAHYLSQVAPVPFSSEFSFAPQIEKRLSAAGRALPINLKVAGEPVHRPYQDELVAGAAHRLRIKDIEIVEFADVDGAAGAVGWIGHHEYVRSIPTGLGVRGLRARFGDIQVGESNLFEDSFKEPRFNGWTLGELHILDRRIVPNARRDNFEVNHHYYNLLVQLGPLAAKIAQRCRSSSVSRNAEQIVRNTIAATAERLKQRRSFDRAELSRLKSAVIGALSKAKRIDDSAVRRELEKKLARQQRALAKITPKRGASAVAFDEAAALVSKLVTNREQARKLIEHLRRLCE
jgi:Histidine kinase-, DNA gyrase B-, and HSP90-like ATPase